MGDVAVLPERFQAVLYLKCDLVDRFLDVSLYFMRQFKSLGYRIAVRDILLFSIRLKNAKCHILFAFFGCKLIRCPFAQTCGYCAVYPSADGNQQPFCSCFQYIRFQKVHPFPDFSLHINRRLNTEGGNNLFLRTQLCTPRFVVSL
ncbi:hypothetical protein D3C75_974630 [compost metagenome]